MSVEGIGRGIEWDQRRRHPTPALCTGAGECGWVETHGPRDPSNDSDTGTRGARGGGKREEAVRSRGRGMESTGDRGRGGGGSVGGLARVALAPPCGGATLPWELPEHLHSPQVRLWRGFGWCPRCPRGADPLPWDGAAGRRGGRPPSLARGGRGTGRCGRGSATPSPGPWGWQASQGGVIGGETG